MDCEQVRDYFLAAIPAPQKVPWPEAVARHLETCEGCGAELTGLERTWALLARWPEATPGEEVRERLMRRVRRRLLRESVATVGGWTPAVLMAAVGVGLSLLFSLLVPYSVLLSLCREALQVSESNPGVYVLAGAVYGLPLALGVWLIRRQALIGGVVGSLEASLLFLVILGPYVIAQCREFAPALQVAFVSGLGGGAVVSSLAALGLFRLVPLSRLQH
ncbi:MAG: hypothetical protein HY725_12735 [Candidatus Rokubacteria bacterium]|nr:hypothetical protein [Candidatus Rokubacteria bacterium]